MNLGIPPGVPGNWGGVIFDGPNHILIGGGADSPTGAIYRVQVTRNLANRVNGFVTGATTQVSTAQFIDGGLWRMPNGTLAYTTYSSNTIGQILPGQSSPASITNLTPLGVDSSTGAAVIIPPGFPGAGQLIVCSYNSGRWFTLPYTVQPNGTYTFATATVGTQTSGGPEGIIYVNTNSPLFTVPSMLVAEYGPGVIASFEVNPAGFPIASTRRPLVIGFPGVYGGTRDPLTGDILYTNYSTGQIVIVRGFGLPVVACGRADIAGAGQFQGYDGELTADDIIVFLNRFFAGDQRANIAGPGQNTVTIDGELTADDIIVYLNRFFAGC